MLHVVPVPGALHAPGLWIDLPFATDEQQWRSGLSEARPSCAPTMFIVAQRCSLNGGALALVTVHEGSCLLCYLKLLPHAGDSYLHARLQEQARHRSRNIFEQQ